MLVVEKFWGFAVGFYATSLTDLKRGSAVTVSAGSVVRADDDTDQNQVYLVDVVRRALRPDQTFDDAENIPADEKVTLYSIREGVFTLSEEHFAAKPSEGDVLYLNSNGKFATSGDIALAVVVRVEGTSSDYIVTIRPYYAT